MLTAAYLFAEGQKQAEIAKTLDLSAAAVSRLLAEARAKYLKEEVCFLRENVDNAKMEEILRKASRSALSEKLDKIANRCTVRIFPSGSRRTGALDWHNRLSTFSRSAAPYIRDLLLRARVCGISWGETLYHVVTALQGIPKPSPRMENVIQVFPMAGELFGADRPITSSSTYLAQALEKSINGRVVSHLSLNMVPAFIPHSFQLDEAKIIWRLIGYVEAYDRIFGHERAQKRFFGHVDSRERIFAPNEAAGVTPLIQTTELILTSVGRADLPLGLFADELFKAKFVDEMTLRRLILGDIAGICFPRLNGERDDPAPGVTEREHALGTASLINERWTGVTEGDIRACSEKAWQHDPFAGSPGVVVVAIGANKARFVYEILRHGLVNHLVTDDDLAEELAKCFSLYGGGNSSQ